MAKTSKAEPTAVHWTARSDDGVEGSVSFMTPIGKAAAEEYFRRKLGDRITVWPTFEAAP